jgi:hypothetical protein
MVSWRWAADYNVLEQMKNQSSTTRLDVAWHAFLFCGVLREG